MSTVYVQESCKSRISYSPSLASTDDGDGIVTTLTVNIKRLNPEELMEQLNFRESDRLWAHTLFETLKKSDALHKHSVYYDAYQSDLSNYQEVE